MLAFAIYIFTDRIPVWADNLLCIGRCCSYWLVYNRLHLFFVGSDRNPVRLNLSQWRLEHMEHYGTLALRGGHEEFLSFTLIHFECAKSRIKNPFQSAELLGIPVFDHYCSCSERVQRADCLGRRSQGIREHLFFPTLTCGVFVFSAVSAPSPPALPPVHTHTHHSRIHHTHTYTHSHPVLPHTHHTHTHTHITHTYITHTHTFTHTHLTHTSLTHTSHTHIHTHTLTHTHLTHTSLTHTSHTQTHTHNHTYNHSHTHTLTHTHSYRSLTHTSHGLRRSAGGVCVAGAALGALQGVGWLLRGRRGTMCTARGRKYALASLNRRSAGGVCVAGAALGGLGTGPMYAPGPLSLRRYPRRGTMCFARGRTYALASLGLRRSAGRVCVASAAQGVGCTPWRPLVSAAVPVAFAWQVRHLLHCQGSDVRPGVPWSPPLCRSRLRGKCGARGRMYALVHWSPPLCRWLLRGRCGTCCTARGRTYALASLGLRRSAGRVCVASAAQGVGCTLWRPLVSAGLPVAFAWQVRHLVLCKGSDVRPGVPWSLPLCRCLLRGRRGTMCSARGRMYALASLGLRRSAGGFCVAGAALGALPRGRMYALASLGLRRCAGRFCVAGAALGALQGVGCTRWRPLVSAALPVAFAWQVRHLVLCQGVGCTPWRRLVSAALPVALRSRCGAWCSLRLHTFTLLPPN